MKRVLVIVILTMTACSSFAYKYYGIQWAERTDEVKLLGTEPKFDRPFTICKPSDDEAGKCVVMPTSELFKMMRDMSELKERNRDLERRCGK